MLYGTNESFVLKHMLGFKRRSTIEIAIAILELARYGIQKTKLVYRTNFNHTLMQKYLDFLVRKNLLEVVYTPRPIFIGLRKKATSF